MARRNRPLALGDSAGSNKDAMQRDGGEQPTVKIETGPSPGEGSTDGSSAPFPMLSLASVGTILAGAAFPSVLVIATFCFGERVFRTIEGATLTEVVAFATIGGVIGGVVAAIFVLPIDLLAALVAYLSGIRTSAIWFGSLIGGWTGFAAGNWFVNVTASHEYRFGLLMLATLTGQCGAGGLLLWRRRRWPLDDDDRPRIALRQLFGITTSVAVVVGGLRLLRLETEIYPLIAYAAGLQAAVIGAGYGIAAWRHGMRPTA